MREQIKKPPTKAGGFNFMMDNKTAIFLPLIL